MLIRPATPDDAETLAELGTATFRETFGHLYRPEDLRHFLATARSVPAFAHVLRAPDTAVLLATEQAVAIGYAVVGPCKLPVERLESSAGELQQLYLLKAFQGSGRGTQLLRTALEHLAAVQHRTPLYVGVWSRNAGAQRLYARFGFRKVGEYDFPVGAQLDREFILRRES